MILADLAVRRPVFATMVVVAIVVFGAVSLSRLGTDLIPKVEFPIISVIATLPGADPETIETTVTDPIEEAVATIASIKHLRSVSTDAVAQVIIEFELEKDIDIAFQEVTSRLAGIRRQLPLDLEEPVVEKFDPDAAPILALIVGGDLPIRELTRLAKDRIKPRLQKIPNVGSVNLIGGREREMQIRLDRQRLEGHRLAVDDVLGALRGGHLQAPGGRLESGSQELVVTTDAECATAAEFARLVVAERNGATIRLGDVASIEDGLQEERSLARLDGKRAVSLEIRRQSGTNTLDVAKAVDRELVLLQKDAAQQGVTLVKAREMAPFIQRSIHEIWTHLLEGGGLAVLIVLFFLRSWRMTLIAALALPASVMGAFIFVQAFGFTLNMLTMLALSLSIGILVDDAIVVIENIHRHHEEGKPGPEAARTGTAEIGLAAFAITLTIVAVFVPVAFMSGMVGRFFYQFGLTVTAAVALSLFIAFTLTPMLTSRLLAESHHSGWFHRLGEAPLLLLESGYRRVIAAALRQRLLTVAIALAAFASALYLGKYLRSEFQPDEDQGEFLVRFEAPLGASLTATTCLEEAVRTRLGREPWIDYVYSNIGADTLGRVNKGEMYVKMLAKGERQRRRLPGQLAAMDLARRRLAGTPGGIITVEKVSRISGGGFKQVDLQVDLRGPDLAGLRRSAGLILDQMRKAGGYTDLGTSDRQGKPELRLHIDRERAASLGVAPSTVASAVRTLIGGEVAVRFKAEGDRHDVRLRLQPDQRQQVADILDCTIRSRTGALIPLRHVVQPVEQLGPVEINRYGRQRQISVEANLVKVAHDGQRTLVLGQAKAEVEGFATAAQLPPGHQVALIGMAEVMQESFQSLLKTLALAVILVYLVLASQFESFIHPFTIMLSLPLSLVGALGALVATGSTMSIFTMIGVIMLMGLVTKNAILLVDYTNTLRQRDRLRRTPALVAAGATRLRPILMTTCATIGGMLPVALGVGEGSETRAPMAITVIGGLITSTLLTLVVVPVVYSLLDDLRGGEARLDRQTRD